jgi:raffinose/stachyose/melibiose transport system substrate-binding protein
MSLMRRSPKPVIVAIAVAAAAATIAACSSSSGTSAGSSSSTSSSAGGRVTLSWWNNATADPLKGVWVSTITAFQTAHPNVTIQNVPHQNEFFKTNMPIALKSNNPPDMPP